MKKRYYVVEYDKSGEIVQDLFNTIETLFIIAIARINERIEVLNIKKGDFYE